MEALVWAWPDHRCFAEAIPLAVSFDHLVGTGQQRRRHGEAEGARSQKSRSGRK